MHEFEYIQTERGILGYLPCGEAVYFESISQYEDEYRKEENEIVDAMAELAGPVEYPEDWWMVQC